MDKRIVSEIWIYPVKSLGGIRLDTSTVLPKGLEHDRRWMLIDENNTCMTQREYPKMALFKLQWQDGKFLISYSGQVMELPFINAGENRQAVIWNDTVEVVEVNRQLSDWIAGLLGTKCRLVAFPEKNVRPVDAQYAAKNEQVSLADGYPLLIIGQSSLDDLNKRLKVPLPMNRFRPNIVFTGGDAFEEDGWKNFRIGETRFAAVKPCARCVMTTVDQYTAEKGKEPLLTLASYRKRGNNIYFGQNLLPLDGHEIKTGDEIILE
ncbi:MAG TPA: MOSC N-terminal beta barrel domain-containing protein [Chitinophagaceae bacterium]